VLRVFIIFLCPHKNFFVVSVQDSFFLSAQDSTVDSFFVVFAHDSNTGVRKKRKGKKRKGKKREEKKRREKNSKGEKRKEFVRVENNCQI
jgi:hypothetical protein